MSTMKDLTGIQVKDRVKTYYRACQIHSIVFFIDPAATQYSRFRKPEDCSPSVTEASGNKEIDYQTKLAKIRQKMLGRW